MSRRSNARFRTILRSRESVLLRLNDWIARALLTIAAVLAFLLCFLVCADVIGRVVFNSPVKGTPEIVSFSIVMILWLQAAYAIRSGGMIWVDALHVHLPARAQRACDVFGALLGIAFFALVCWGSVGSRPLRLALERVRGRGRAARAGRGRRGSWS